MLGSIDRKTTKLSPPVHLVLSLIEPINEKKSLIDNPPKLVPT